MVKELFFYIISFLTIVNPLAGAAILVSLEDDPHKIPHIARRASSTLFIASIITLLAGGAILKLFGINIPSIKAIGGVILLTVALHMVQGREVVPTRSTEEEHLEAAEKEDIAIIPLTIPILFGPGSITTLIVLSEKAQTFLEKWLLAGGVAITTLVTYLTLRNGIYISKFLGVNGIKIATRLMGLVIGAIGFIFLVGGVKALWLAS